MPTATPKPLTDTQRDALRALHKDPGEWVESATLSFLRRRGLARHLIEIVYLDGKRAGQKTTSPLTDAGRAEIGVMA